MTLATSMILETLIVDSVVFGYHMSLLYDGTSKTDNL